jgi:hypothetical protein
VVVGNIVDRAPLLFGPALIDAYQIESKIAKFPRVIIDQTFFDSATLEGTEYRRDYLGAENEEHLKAEIRNLMKTLIQDGDFTILHYLGAAHNEKPEDHAAYLKQADTYVAAITAIPPNDPSAVEKHEWLKAYFRRTTRALNFAS